ncbi:hypothetical protein [Shewanella frigidimarina]|nr:hypothetical protein [Shewanella frigidimarina]
MKLNQYPFVALIEDRFHEENTQNFPYKFPEHGLEKFDLPE